MSRTNPGTDADDGSGLTETADRSGVYRVAHDPDGPATVSDTVIEAIAEVAGVDPTSTVIPLADRVDPDALDDLFADDAGDARVSFRVCGLDVFVRSDGHVRIVDDSVTGVDDAPTGVDDAATGTDDGPAGAEDAPTGAEDAAVGVGHRGVDADDAVTDVDDAGADEE